MAIGLLNSFIQWNEKRFTPQKDAHDSDEIVGWKGGKDTNPEWCIKPKVWQDIFEPLGLDPVETARICKQSGVLRVQEEGSNLQVVIIVREAGKREPVRAYAVNAEALDKWQPITGNRYDYYGPAQLEPDRPPISLIPAIPAPPDLAGKLEAATSLALDEVLGIMRMQLDPEDRTFQTILRAKSAIINTVLTNQVRVDEAKLRQRSDDALPALLARIEAALKAQDAKG